MKPRNEPPQAVTPADPDGGPIRLSKRIAALVGCSRSEAERYIEGGWVSVDGKVIEVPMEKVRAAQTVTLAADASLAPLPSITLLYHKPAGQTFGADNQHSIASIVQREITAANCAEPEHAQTAMLNRHLARLVLPCPIEPLISGLVVLTQDGRIARKLIEDAKLIEQEIIVEIKEGQAALSASALKRLNFGLAFQGKPLPPCKVSWQNETRLRFAIKGPKPGQIVDMCAAVGLTVVGMKRIRIGRLSMAGLPVGQWRYLADQEKF